MLVHANQGTCPSFSVRHIPLINRKPDANPANADDQQQGRPNRNQKYHQEEPSQIPQGVFDPQKSIPHDFILALLPAL